LKICQRWKKICERIGNLIGIIDFIDVLFIMTGSLLQGAGFSNVSLNKVVAKQIVKFGIVLKVLARIEGRLVAKPIPLHGNTDEFHFCHG
jgi:hypothetical protein